MINDVVKKYIEKSVLCWLATVDKDNTPNVSPKELFTYKDERTLLIANLASPNSVGNIKVNPHVCVSFVDVFVQKGYKLKGKAQLIHRGEISFNEEVKPITDLFSDKFPIISVIKIAVEKIEPIQAPSYFLYPDTTENKQIENALKTYKVKSDWLDTR